MFVGRTYRQVGYGSRSIRFADADGGVATTTYSYSMSDEERAEMARRITAALNLTTNLTVEQMEQAAPFFNPAKLK
jgi:hypothetical protein